MTPNIFHHGSWTPEEKLEEPIDVMIEGILFKVSWHKRRAMWMGEARAPDPNTGKPLTREAHVYDDEIQQFLEGTRSKHHTDLTAALQLTVKRTYRRIKKDLEEAQKIHEAELALEAIPGYGSF